MNKVAIARKLAYASLALSPLPVVGLVTYAELAPEHLDVKVESAISLAMLTTLMAPPVAASLAMWLGRGTSARRLGIGGLGLWLLVCAFLAYTSVR